MKKIFISLICLFGTCAMANGDSGCGLGSVIISQNAKGLQLLSLTTNHSFFSQAFGITTGTSNCSSSGFASNERERQYFAQANFQELSKNMARGEGETLSAFAVLNGCLTPESKTEFASTIKANMGEVIPSEKTDSIQLVANVRLQMEKNQKLNQLCSAKL